MAMEKMSRREFLKWGAGGLAFLAELSLSTNARAELEKLLTGREFIRESFEAGIERLKREVYEAQRERFYVFVRKGELSGWLNIEETMSLDMGKSIDLLPLLEDGKVAEMHFVHTHPLLVVETDKMVPQETLDKIKRSRKSDFPLLPSSTDFATVAKQKRFLLERGLPQKLSHSVLDPAGIWTYDADIEHPAMKDISKIKEPLTEGESVPDADLLVMSAEESALFRLGLELQTRQEQFYKNKAGIADTRAMEDLKSWGKDAWGVRLGFVPYASE